MIEQEEERQHPKNRVMSGVSESCDIKRSLRRRRGKSRRNTSNMHPAMLTGGQQRTNTQADETGRKSFSLLSWQGDISRRCIKHRVINSLCDSVSARQIVPTCVSINANKANGGNSPISSQQGASDSPGAHISTPS